MIGKGINESPWPKLLAAALVLPSGFALAGSLDSGSTSDTAVSGYSGAAGESFVLSATEGYGIIEIVWQESGDKPCYIKLRGKDPGTGGDTNSTSRDTGCNHTAYSKKTVKFKDSPRYFVRGISVCSNGKSNHRLKGIKIYAAKLPAGNGVVDSLTVSKKKERTNCKDWNTPVYCASNKVASGLNVKVKDGAMVGLGLQCRGRL